MENDAKMDAKWRPKSLENLKICEKGMPKNYAEFVCLFLDYGGDFGSISVAYGNIPAPGLRKEKTRSQEFLRIVF